MSKYIRAVVAAMAIEEKYGIPLGDLVDTFADIPAADVAPVVHAKWDANGRCTNCGEHAPFYSMASTYHESPYCFECGAKMDKEEACQNGGN